MLWQALLKTKDALPSSPVHLVTSLFLSHSCFLYLFSILLIAVTWCCYYFVSVVSYEKYEASGTLLAQRDLAIAIC